MQTQTKRSAIPKVRFETINVLGMNYVAAMLYKVLGDIYEAFIALIYIMKVLGWRCVYLN